MYYFYITGCVEKYCHIANGKMGYSCCLFVLTAFFALIPLAETSNNQTFSFTTVDGKTHHFNFNYSSPSQCVFIDSTGVLACMDRLPYSNITSAWTFSGRDLQYVAVSCLHQRVIERHSHMCICKNKPTDVYFLCHIEILYQGLFNQTRNLQVLDLSYNMIDTVRPRSFYGLQQVQYLSLRNNPFRHLPYGVFCDMKNLEFLDLSDLDLDVFPSHCFKCESDTSKVKAIDISNSKLRDVPKGSLDPLSSLTSLNLANNLLGELHETSFEGGVSLMDLNLSDNALKYLIKDTDFCTLLPNLRTLYLRRNEFDLFDFQELRNCKLIEVLDISSNNISSLSGSVSNLTSLKYLNISSNNLKTFHFDLQDLSRLETLDISYNHLSKLAEDKVAGLESLIELYINHNYFNESDNFPDFFKFFPSMKVLDIQYNQITHIPVNSFAELSNLTILYINDNKITNLYNDSFAGLGNLKQLNLDNNALGSLPFSVFKPLVSVEHVSLSNNRLLTVNIKFWPSSLQFLDLGDNHLVSLPDGLQHTNIKHLNMTNNSLNVFNTKGEILKNLETLDLSRNRLLNLSESTFTFFPRLLHLNLEYNGVSLNLSYNYFRGSSKLKWLNLAHNKITALSQLFFADSLNSLETLNVSYNPINEVQQLAVNFSEAQLKTIDFSSCNISSLDSETFADLTNLSSVRLNDNNMEIFEPFNAVIDTSFDLSGNPVLCSCHMAWLKDHYVEVEGKKIPRYKYIVPKCKVYTLDGIYSPGELRREQYLCLEVNGCSSGCTCFKQEPYGEIVSVMCRGGLQTAPNPIPQSALTLFLDGNNFANDTLKPLSSFKNMSAVEIYMNRSSITSLNSRIFVGFNHLQIISLAGNLLTTIPALLFANHSRLKQIYLQDNWLSNFEPGVFSGLTNLQELDISNNKFRVLGTETATELSSLPAIKYFFLAGNRWVCTCDNIYFKDFIDKVKFKIRDRRQLICNGQEILYVPKSSFTCVVYDKLTSNGIGKTVIIVIACVILAFLIGAALMYFRRECLSVLYSVTGLHIPRRHHVAGKTFDLFVGYDSADQHASQYVQTKLLPQLRKFHYNYQSSKDVIQDIEVTKKTIEDSKCSVFVMNNNFATNSFLVKVFHIASDYSKLDRHKVVLVIHGDIDILTLEPEVVTRLHKGDYITARSRLWWQRLKYELPLPTRLHADDNDDGSETDTIIFSAIPDEGFYNSMTDTS